MGVTAGVHPHCPGAEHLFQRDQADDASVGATIERDERRNGPSETRAKRPSFSRCCAAQVRGAAAMGVSRRAERWRRDESLPALLGTLGATRDWRARLATCVRSTLRFYQRRNRAARPCARRAPCRKRARSASAGNGRGLPGCTSAAARPGTGRSRRAGDVSVDAPRAGGQDAMGHVIRRDAARRRATAVSLRHPLCPRPPGRSSRPASSSFRSS